MVTYRVRWLCTLAILTPLATILAADPPAAVPLPAGAIARLGSIRLRHGAAVTAVPFSPDNKWLASASADRTARIWDAVTGKELARLPHDGEVRAVVFSPDGKRLATAGADRLVHLWDPLTARETQALTGHEDQVDGLAFSNDGQSLAVLRS